MTLGTIVLPAQKDTTRSMALFGDVNRKKKNRQVNVINLPKGRAFVTMQNGWNNRISDGCVYAQIRRGLGMHLVIYSNHDTVLFLLIVPIKGRFV